MVTMTVKVVVCITLEEIRTEHNRTEMLCVKACTYIYRHTKYTI